jgi:tetratricopeptide (TPR) repeat protein
MTANEKITLIDKGREALSKGDTLSALSWFEKAAETEDNPSARSYLAFCMAKERGLLTKGISWCEESLSKEPENAVHYLNLGRIYLLMKKREEAIRNFREGLKYGSNEEIADELHRLGIRSSPVLSFLKRSNPLNKYLGILLKMLRLRS